MVDNRLFYYQLLYQASQIMPQQGIFLVGMPFYQHHITILLLLCIYF